MTYDSLLVDIRRYLERGFTQASDQIVFDQLPRLITLAERRIARELKIEGFINFCFDDVAGEAIIFYIYGRKTDGDEINPFVDPNGKEYYFNNLDELWEFLLFWAEEMMRL